MLVDPLILLRTFAEAIGVATELADQFAAEHPELVEPGPEPAPQLAPVDDLDPEVRARIERGEL